MKHVAFATLDDIDLKLLTKRMAPESALKEPDNPWNWDVIFAEVKKNGFLRKGMVRQKLIAMETIANHPQLGILELGDRPKIDPIQLLIDFLSKK